MARKRRAAFTLAGVTRQKAHATVVPIGANSLLALEVKDRCMAAARVEHSDRRVRRGAVAGCMLFKFVRAFVRLQTAVDVTAAPLKTRFAVISSLVAAIAALASGCVAGKRRELTVGTQFTLSILDI